jgi:hypothetical protein
MVGFRDERSLPVLPFCFVGKGIERKESMAAPATHRNIPPTQEPHARTTRLDVAAFLLVRAFEIARVELENNTAAFIRQQGDSVMREFYNGGQVSASEYADAQKRVRDLMWEARRRTS